MSEISRLTGVNIEHVCNGGVSTLWTRILDDIVLKEISKISELDAEQKEDRILLLERYYNRDYYQSQFVYKSRAKNLTSKTKKVKMKSYLMKRQNRNINQ